MLTYTLPQRLQQEFEEMAQTLYAENGPQKALVEAIELWLDQQRRQRLKVETELNNQFFETIKTSLAETYSGQWVLIAEGRVQGVASQPETLNELAPHALHRLLIPLIEPRPQEVELGWQMTFT